MGKAIRGDLGVSIVRGDPVFTDILRRFPATVELAVAAIVLALLLGIPIGIVSAVWRKSLIDSLSRVLALTGVSMPIFWLGVMLAWVFAVELRWLPTGARLDSVADYEPWTHFVLLDAVLQRNWAMIPDALRHLVLPAIALATIPLAVIARMMRASMLEILSRDYIRTADAKGLSRAAVVLRHGLRNALLPVLTVVGLQVGSLLAGAILTETIFSWPGIGRWVYESIESRDYPIVQGASLFIGGHRGRGEPLHGPPLRRGRSADQVRLMGVTTQAAALDPVMAPAARGQSPAAAAWRRLLSSPVARVGLVIVCVFVLVAVLAPFVHHYDPKTDSSLTERLRPPSGAHPFGTDSLGRDNLVRVIHAARVSLGLGISS